jgi:hypothetical protein
MRNGVVVIPPHDFKKLCRRYYRLQKVKNYEFSELTYGTQRPRQISLISVMSFSIYEMRADGYHL